jgi:hypothetical protein
MTNLMHTFLIYFIYLFTAWERHGMCESNTATVCKSNGKTQCKVLAERHGRGTAGEQHGNGMVCMNPS